MPITPAAGYGCFTLPDEIAELDSRIEQGQGIPGMRQLHQKRYQYIVLNNSLCPEGDRIESGQQTADPQVLRDRMLELGLALMARISAQQDELLRKSRRATQDSRSLPEAPPEGIAVVVSRYQERVREKSEEPTELDLILERMRGLYGADPNSALPKPRVSPLPTRMPNPIVVLPDLGEFLDLLRPASRQRRTFADGVKQWDSVCARWNARPIVVRAGPACGFPQDANRIQRTVLNAWVNETAQEWNAYWRANGW